MVASSYPGWKEEMSPGMRLVEGWKGDIYYGMSGVKGELLNGHPGSKVSC